MGGLIYDDDLTFLDPSLAAAIRHIHQRASAAVAAIEAADNNVELNAALASLIFVKNEAFEKLLDDAIAESDMPFGEVSSNDGKAARGSRKERRQSVTECRCDARLRARRVRRRTKRHGFDRQRRGQ